MDMTTLPAIFSNLPNLSLPQLVRDIVLYGDENLQAVLRAHSITEDEFAELATTEEFSKAIEDLSNELKSQGLVKVKAKDILGDKLITLSQISDNTAVEPADRIRAIELIAKLADALPKNSAAQATGPLVSINFGSMLPARQAEVIDVTDKL